MSEKWRPVPNYEGVYWVSNMGRVKSTKTILSQYTKGIYCTVGLYKEGKGRTVNVHSLVAGAFLGTVRKGYCVNHIDGDPKNNRLSNLEIVTYGENLRHAYIICRRSKSGERHHANKIGNDELRKIRKLLSLGATQESIGKMFGIHQSTVSDIKTGRTWGCE